MLLLTLTAVRTSASHEDLAQLVLQGDIASAMRMASDRFERAACAADPALTTLLPLAAQRLQHLQHLQHLLSREGNAISAAVQVDAALAWLRERRLVALEAEARIEAARMLIGRDAVYAAGEVIAPLTANEQQAQRGRHGVELAYCMARLHQHHGRPQDALRLYRQHTQLAVLALRHEGGQKKTPRFLALPQAAAQGSALAAVAGSPAGDAARMRLPLRYRRAYQFIMEHLNDENLSVRQVAAHVDVTERALQLAFRSHLGMTPLELIRTRRMERIRDELSQETGGRGVREVAARWGITNRSTLSNSYRLHFDETPSQTLRGGVRTRDDEPTLRMAAGMPRPRAPGLGTLSA